LEETYAEPPEGFEEPGGQVWLLLKALYGLRQANRRWFDTIYDIFKELGFTQGKVDQCVFQKRCANGVVIYILLYVDDMLVASTSDENIEEFKKDLTSKVNNRDMGPVSNFLGMQIEKDESKQCFLVSQEKLISDYAIKFQLKDAKPIRNLTEVEHYPHEVTETNPFLDGDDFSLYRSLVSSMLYVTHHTRPDACFAVNYLSRFMKKPAKSHLTCAKKVFQYLHTTKEYKLHLGKLDNRPLTGYSDASFASTPGFRSQSGNLFTLHGSLILWTSRKQPFVAGSTTESETIALFQATEDCLFLRDLLTEWNVKHTSPTTIFEDNQQTIKQVNTRRTRGRTKHLSIKYAYINEKILMKQIGITYIPSNQQWADMLTKTKVPLKVGRLFSGTSPHGL